MPVTYPVEKIIDEEGNVLALVDVSARALLGDDILTTNAKTCTGAINELKGTLTVKAKEISGTTDAQGRLLSTGFSIANKAVVGVISGGHGQIALQLRLSNNNFAVKFLDSSGMSVIANTSCSCMVYYVDTFEMQT